MGEIDVGERLLRREVHAVFGGRRQGGIGPSRTTPTVLFFSDPATGHRHGYYDGWADDGYFHYTGEGQRGDQQMVQGNKAILRHREEGRALKGFVADGRFVTFLGDFEVVDTYDDEAPQTGSDLLRRVIVFRLRALGDVAGIDLPRKPITPSKQKRVDVVPLEAANTERAMANPNQEPYEFERRESALVARYVDHLSSIGQRACRLRIVPSGEAAPLFCDVWCPESRDLVEAKSLVTRSQIRMAVGQLIDYRRFVDAATCAVLVPSRPRADLLAYLSVAGVSVVFPEGSDWVRLDPAVAENSSQAH